MKHFFTISLCFLALSLSAQTDGWEYPFPYNPDGDSDGYITLSDLLDLLALYGNEYPDSFHYDDSGALLHLGQMEYRECMISAKEADGNWRILTFEDWNKWFNTIASINYNLDDNPSDWYANVHAHNYKNGRPDHIYIAYDNQNSMSDIPNLHYTQYNSYSGTAYSITTNRHCFIVTEVRPEIEYYVSFGSLYQVKEEVNDSLSNGWNLIGGFSNNSSSSCSQAIWRWAE